MPKCCSTEDTNSSPRSNFSASNMWYFRLQHLLIASSHSFMGWDKECRWMCDNSNAYNQNPAFTEHSMPKRLSTIPWTNNGDTHLSQANVEPEGWYLRTRTRCKSMLWRSQADSKLIHSRDVLFIHVRKCPFTDKHVHDSRTPFGVNDYQPGMSRYYKVFFVYLSGGRIMSFLFRTCDSNIDWICSIPSVDRVG